MKTVALLYLTCVMPCFDQSSSWALLNRLQGDWSMKGTVIAKPVQYVANGSWILNDQFLAFHMMDTTIPPAYEATLYLGIDSAKNEYVVHWLDSFGGPGARVVGFGPLSGERIEIIYPYPEGRFRNLFKYDLINGEWSLLIESEKSNGQWSFFAQYTITKKH